MVSWLSGDWGKACVALTLMPRLTGVLALKVGPMFDGWRTRALVTAATSLRPAFVVFVGLCLVQMLTGCIFTSARPDLAPDLPPKYGAGQGQSAPPTLDWWRSFRSRELTNLIEEAQIANLDIAAAIGRILQADAQAKIAGVPLLPEVDFVGFAERFKNPGLPERNLFHAALNASYAIAFWGKNRANSRAAQESAVASRFNKEIVVLSTIVSVGNAYFQVLSSQDRLRIARDNFNIANRILTLIKQRFDAGTASQLDIAQQESLVAQVRANIPIFDQTLRQNIAVLAVLIGKPPVEVVIKGGNIYQLAIPRVTPGLPSELLFQRPDIRAAEANLASADASVEAARAAFFPNISLTGQGGYESNVLKLLFTPQRPSRERTHSGARHCRACGRCPGLSRRRRHRESTQHRDGALAGRRQNHQHIRHRRAGRAGGIRARQDRPRDLPGRVRPDRRQEGPGRSAACQCPARSGPLHPPGDDQRRQQAAARYPEGAGQSARGADQARPGGDR